MKMKFDLILASNSPRRQQLLSELGLPFTVKVKPVDETFPDHLPATEVAEFLARKKAMTYQSDLSANELVITADTTVVVDTLILNKPNDFPEAQSMLNLLSGRSHEVITGVCLVTQNRQISFKDCTRVFFKPLRKAEIDYYVHHFQPYDKAGGYAIQEWIGMIGIERIEGSYFNVVGLPVEKLYRQLESIMDDGLISDRSSNALS